MGALALEMRDISKSFPGVKALEGVSFDCAAGEVHAICGENGAGKSTLIKILGGANQPDSGRLRVGGESEWQSFLRFLPPKPRKA